MQVQCNFLNIEQNETHRFSRYIFPINLRVFEAIKQNGLRIYFQTFYSTVYNGFHSPLASAEVKKMWIYASTPPYAFMA
jgi:hypothetical protein